MKKIIKYRDIFSATRGIFNGVILPTSITADETQLNIVMLSKVGQRTLSPIANDFITFADDTPTITDENLQVLTSIINSLYNTKWEKLAETLNLQYVASDNYKRVELEQIENEGGENVTGNEETKNKVYGYDSENATNDKSENVTNTNATTTTNNRERNLTVSGKMGGTSYQSLIREELKLRRENVLIDLILDDIKNFITSPIY